MAEGNGTMNTAAFDWTRLLVQLGGWAVVAWAFVNEMPKIRQAHESVTAAMMSNTAAMNSLKEINAELIRELRTGTASKKGM